MGAGRAGAVVEIAADTVFMRVLVMMIAIMHMGVAVLAAIGVAMDMLMGAERRGIVAVAMLTAMIVSVIMGVAMHRAIGMNVGVFVRVVMFVGMALDLHFTGAATANCTHRLVS